MLIHLWLWFTNDLLVGGALAHFTTPHEPGFVVTCNLYFIDGLHPFKKWNFFIGKFLSFYWCYLHRHTVGDMRGFKCLPKRFPSSLVNPPPIQKRKLWKNVVSNVLESDLALRMRVHSKHPAKVFTVDENTLFFLFTNNWNYECDHNFFSVSNFFLVIFNFHGQINPSVSGIEM